MNRWVVVLSVAASICVSSASLFAHHSFSAEYDQKKPIVLKGTITSMQWVNPHAWLHVGAKGPDGKMADWAVEFGGSSGLYRRGFRPKDLPVGAEVTIEGWLARDGSNTMNASNVTMADGKKLFAGSPGAGGPAER